MRTPRLLIIVGPAAVLYVLAARASSESVQAANWFVASSALACSLLPVALLGTKVNRRISAVAIMATSLALSFASARTFDFRLDVLHGAGWLVVAAVALDLAVPQSTSRWIRLGAIAGFAFCASLAALVSRLGLVPPETFGAVVVAGLLIAGALHQVALTARGRVIEGGLSAVAMVILAVGLAYAWFGPLEGTLATVVETLVGILLWLAHLTWVDARWRGLRRTGVPVLVASAVVFLVAYAWFPSPPVARWEQSAAAVAAAFVSWVVLAVARRLSRRTVWSTSEQLVGEVAAARRALDSASDLDAVAVGVLGPLTTQDDGRDERPEIVAFEPPIRVRLASGGRIDVRTGEAPASVMRAFGNDPSPSILDLVPLRSRVVREPAVRDLVETMDARGIGAIVPCVQGDHFEGLLVLPLGRRAEPLSSIESDALARLGRALAARLSSALAERRAQSHIHRVSELRRSAESRVAELEAEVQQLRGQCDALGRGFTDEPSMHVAYSPSMRRVQTRAIELAADDGPILVCGALGSPLLQVCRFIHDRSPRCEAPFIVVDCATTAPEEAMSRLFGEGGESTGWIGSALDGTVLLRDLPALPREVQARLSTLVDGSTAPGRTSSGPRVIATARTTLEGSDPLGSVDPELLRVLGENALQLPSLRERREDVPSLVLLSIDRACRVLARDPVGVDQAAMAALVDHEWPGDVAELELVIQLAVARVRKRNIGVSDLPPLAWAPAPLEEALDGTYAEVERRLLEQALRATGGNKSQAARRLGLKRTTFLDKLRRHGLERPLSGDVGGSAVG